MAITAIKSETMMTLEHSGDEMIIILLGGAMLFGILVFGGLFCLPRFSKSLSRFLFHIGHYYHHNLRPTTDDDVNRIPVRIPSLRFDMGTSLDVGGWLFFHQFHQPKRPIDYGQPYRGDLFFVGPFGKERSILPNDEALAEEYWESTHNYNKPIKVHLEHNEELDDQEMTCRRPSWIHLYNPNCNAIHEIDMSCNYQEDTAGLGSDQVYDTFYISHGYYRDVWVIYQPEQDLKSILKVTRWSFNHDIGILFSDLRDALIMERLTASPRIVDIYGHCGTAVWVEAIPYEIEEVIVPGDGYAKQEDLHDELELKPKNDFTAEEKLDMAISMAESLADLHGFKDGVIVHDDVQLCQWLRTKDGRLKLGDFNRAEIMEFDEKKGEYCKYINGAGFGNYRSPEEYIPAELDEKIDVFTFGNNIYALLTGLWVFYENEDDEVVQGKLIKGEKAFIDPRYRTRSFIEGRLVEIIEKCWPFEPDKRIDIFEVLRLLKQTKEDYIKLRTIG